MNFLEASKDIEQIISCTEVRLTDDLKKAYQDEPGTWEMFEKNDAQANIYKIRYRSQMHEVVGYIVEPKNIQNPLPCIVYNRGGSREFGMIKRGHLFGSIAEMANWGYIVIASQYSGNDGGEGKDEFGGNDIKDVENLYLILEQYRNADTLRIGMYGGSRGGMMTYQMLTRVDWIKAAVTRAGTANIFRNQRERPIGMKKTQEEMFGPSREEKIKRSALYWPEKFPKDVPILMMHGTADWRVNPLDSIDLSKKFLKLKIPHRLALFEGADHGITEFREETLRMTKDWFHKYVRDLASLPNMELHGN